MLGRLVHTINTLPLWFFIRRAKTILDVGCGVTSPLIHFVRAQQIVDGIDIIPLQLPQYPYRRLWHGDFRSFTPPQRYDVIVAFDVIEHLSKPEGFALLHKLESYTQRLIVVTPNGYMPQAPFPDNPWQEHLSGWDTEDFVKRGYRVYGMFGPKIFRGEMTMLRYRPKWLWGILVWLLTPIFFWLPRYSFSLLAIYDKR
jgi:SAM-dependent methyltransferase